MAEPEPEEVPPAPGSRVFRQVVTMELVLVVDPDWEPQTEYEREYGHPKVDGDAIVRDAVMAADWGWGTYVVPGHGEASALVEMRSTT